MEKIKHFFLNLNLTVKHYLTVKEVFLLLFFIFISFLSLIFLIYKITDHIKIERIVYSGSIKEGVVGTPKVTNPFQSINQAERNLSKLLFSSLIKNIDSNGNFELGLAEMIETNNNKKDYKIFIDKDAKFSNGKSIESEDVIYSLQNIPYEKNFTTEVIDNKTLLVKFSEASKRQSHLETFTFPIIIKDENFDENYSSDLITSSSFIIDNVVQDKGGNITSISLNRFDNGENKLPYLESYRLFFYTDEAQALSDFQARELQLISGISGQVISKIKDDKSFSIINSKLANNFSLFINQNENEVLREVEFRKTLSESIDRAAMVNQIFGGYALAQKNILGENEKNESIDNLLKELPTGLKLKNGVLYNADKPVKISITTINNKELIDTANFVANSWRKLGVETQVKTIERSSLQQVVKDRDFDILLFGFSVKSSADYYSFFHSKERAYPKLNIANYTRKKVDSLLEDLVERSDNFPKDTKSIQAEQNLIVELSNELENDMPVIILYKPFFVQALSAKVNAKMPENIQEETDKYRNVNNWYTSTEKVLPFFESIQLLKSTSIRLDKLFN